MYVSIWRMPQESWQPEILTCELHILNHPIMRRVWRGNRLQQCFLADVYNRDMTTAIWLILQYDRAWKKARPYDIAWKKDLSYTWYMCIYTKYRVKYTKYRAKYTYTRDMIVYTRYKQVYKSFNRYVLMTCQYILVYIIVISIFHFRISWRASWCSPEGGGTATH